MTHDDKRHGTTTLFAAFDVVTGACDGLLPAEPSPQEFLTFLTTIDTEVPEGLDVHLILDNYAAQKHPNVQTWLARRPRFQLARHPHLLVVVEPRRTLVRELTDKALRRGVFHSVLDLIAAIEDYINGSSQLGV